MIRNFLLISTVALIGTPVSAGDFDMLYRALTDDDYIIKEIKTGNIHNDKPVSLNTDKQGIRNKRAFWCKIQIEDVKQFQLYLEPDKQRDEIIKMCASLGVDLDYVFYKRLSKRKASTNVKTRKIPSAYEFLTNDNVVQDSLCLKPGTCPRQTSEKIRELRQSYCKALIKVGASVEKQSQDICMSLGVPIVFNSERQGVSQQKSTNTSRCQPNKWCIAEEGVDMLGQQKIAGWAMMEDVSNQEVHYVERDAKKVNVRGKTDRYIAYETLINSYQDAKAGRAPSTRTYGSAKTDCRNIGNTISCTTSPASIFTMPGTPGQSAGVIRNAYTIVIDCKEKTVAWHKGNDVYFKWKPIESDTIDSVKETTFCPNVENLVLSGFRKYAAD